MFRRLSMLGILSHRKFFVGMGAIIIANMLYATDSLNAIELTGRILI